MTLRRILPSLVIALSLVPAAPAQRISPPPPANYDVIVRYRIRVGGNERVVQYREMMRSLAAIGFKRTDEPDPNEPVDPDADRLAGTIASGRVAELLGEPHVRTILLMPAGYKLPEDPNQRALVQIKLAQGFLPIRQRELFYQSLDKLRRIRLVEKIGYDREEYTRILGTIPAADVETLVGDLRLQPAGWLTLETPVEALPEPIRDVNPIRGVEVLPEPQGVPPTAPPPPLVVPPGADAKIAPDLRPVLDRPTEIVRFEVVLTNPPPLDDTAWRDFFAAVPGIAVEGRIGPVVTITAPAAAIRTLAAAAEVATVRPPRLASRPPDWTSHLTSPAALADSGLDRLHKLGYRGQGVRIAIIDAEFGGLADRLGKELPKKTTLIDLTALRNTTLLPDPIAEGTDPGRGTRLAITARYAAPEAELVLIRVDPAAMYQLLTVARYIHGDAARPVALVARNRELLAENDVLRVERAKLTADRQAVIDNFTQDEEADHRRNDIATRSAALAQREQAFNDRLSRFYAIDTDLADLSRVSVVVCPLAWDEGYSFDGSGPLARYLDDHFYGRPRMQNIGPVRVPSRSALWFQAAGNTRGQLWNGPLVDPNGTGAYQFAPTEVPLPPTRWSRENNFLAWQPAGADRTFDLPSAARVRLVFQWTEAHDPAVSAIVPDQYRTPLADLRMLVLRERDPSGTRLGTDDFNVIARTDPLPQMIERHPSWATYEHVVEFAVDAPGRFAVRLEGTITPITRPASIPTLPIQERTWTPHGRLVVSLTGVPGGRVVFGDYQPGLGGLGAPGNALYPRTVGAADAQGRPQPYSAAGPPSGQQLLVKPTFVTFDELTLPGVPSGGGTEQSAAFAGGMMASMQSAGTIESQQLKWLQIPRGGLLRVPAVWMDQIERRLPKTGRE